MEHLCGQLPSSWHLSLMRLSQSFLPVENRSYNRDFKISSTILCPPTPPPLKLSPKMQKRSVQVISPLKRSVACIFPSIQPSFLCFKIISLNGIILKVPSGIQTHDLTTCFYLNLKRGELDHSATTAEQIQFFSFFHFGLETYTFNKPVPDERRQFLISSFTTFFFNKSVGTNFVGIVVDPSQIYAR